MIHRILAYHLAALLFLSNLGVPVFTHICKGMGRSWTSVLLPARSCCSHVKKVAETPASTKQAGCCAQKVKAGSCCENRVSLVQLDCDLPVPPGPGLSIDDAPDYLATSNVPYTATFVVSTSFFPHDPPWPDQAKTLLLKYQVFRC